jgi:hypothetical protein
MLVPVYQEDDGWLIEGQIFILMVLADEVTTFNTCPKAFYECYAKAEKTRAVLKETVLQYLQQLGP